jgi:hypothetical protein
MRRFGWVPYGFGFKTEEQSFEDYRDEARLLLGLTMFQSPNIGIAKAGLESESAGQYVCLSV